MMLEVYVDGRYVGSDLHRAVYEAVGRFLEDLASHRKGRNVIARLLTREIQKEFVNRDAYFTGQLVRDVNINRGTVFFYAPHSVRWAKGYHSTARKGPDGLFHDRASDPQVLTEWVRRKAPHLQSRDSFEIRIPERKGFVKDAFVETIEARIDGVLHRWIHMLVKNDPMLARLGGG